MWDGVHFLIEILVVLSIVTGVHALRHKTSLVFCYAMLTFTTFASWATPHDAVMMLFSLDFHVESSVFFTASLIGVFLLYVADGPRAGRMGIVVVVATGLLYCLFAVITNAYFTDATVSAGAPFPLAGPRAILASFLASVLDMVLLGILWESSQKLTSRMGLFGRVFITLSGVLLADAVIYNLVAWAGRPAFESFPAAVLIRSFLVAIYAPMVTMYLSYEIRRHGLVLHTRPVFSILTKEDLERELVSAHHNLRIGTEALWESEERYRRIVEDIPLMVFRFSAEGMVTYANRASCDYFEQSEWEVIGQPVIGPVDKAERERVWSAISSLNPKRPTTEIEVCIYPRPNDRRIHRWVVRSIFSEEGHGLAYQAIGEDITEQWRQERSLNRLQAAIAQTSELIAITDTAGHLEFINAAGVSSGLFPETVDKDWKIFDLCRGEDQEASFKPMIDAVQAGRAWSGRVQRAFGSDSSRTFEFSITPLVEEPLGLTGYLLIARDMTQQIRIESRLQQIQKMEAVMQLAGGVAHDFNNLLLVITTSSDLLMDDIQSLHGEVSPAVVERLNAIAKSASRAVQLNHQLMSLGRQTPTAPRRINLNHVVFDTVPLLQSILPETVRIHVDLDDSLPAVFLDPAHMERVIINLVVNARDAMPAGGDLTLITRIERLNDDYLLAHTDARPGKHVVLMVRDTGQGMDEETSQRIFEPFFTTKEESGGTGLGLSVVYTIIRQANGHIRVDSALGAGTAVWVYLPSLPAKTASAGSRHMQKVAKPTSPLSNS